MYNYRFLTSLINMCFLYFLFVFVPKTIDVCEQNQIRQFEMSWHFTNGGIDVTQTLQFIIKN